MALVNLALLTGNLGKPGAGVNPLRGQNNVQGAAHMGCDPGMLPGSTPLDAGRETFEPHLGCAAPLRARTPTAGHARCRLGRRVQGPLGDRVRRAAVEPTRTADDAGDGSARAGDRAGSLHDGDGTAVRRCVPSGVLVVREGGDLHERRAADPAGPPGDSARRRVEARLADPLRRGPRDGTGRGIRVRQRRNDLERGASGLRGRARDVLRETGNGGAAVAVSGRGRTRVRRFCTRRRSGRGHGPRSQRSMSCPRPKRPRRPSRSC